MRFMAANKTEKRFMVTRFSVQPDERRVLMGVDKGNVFEAGVVYEAVKILGEIVLRPVGKYALDKKGYPSENSTVDVIMYSGLHLVTKEEQQGITKCKGTGCPIKKMCYRYTASNGIRQGYISEPPWNEANKTCEMFWGEANDYQAVTTPQPPPQIN